MSTKNKLNVVDSLKTNEGKKYPLRLREDLNSWIEENATGSKNSVINLLVQVGINQVDKILEHDSIYEHITTNK